MFNSKAMAISGLAITCFLLGCPRSKLPPNADPRITYQASDVPPPPPWRVPTDPKARLALAGLPSVEDAHQAAYHIHAGLRIYYQGQPVAVPAGIGLDKYGTPVSPIHTHRASGVVHVEFPEARPFRWGQFFALWGVPLGKATVYVNGEPVADLATLLFADRQQVVVIFKGAPTTPIAWPTPDPAEDLPAPDPDVTASPAPEEGPDELPSPEPISTPVATPSDEPEEHDERS